MLCDTENCPLNHSSAFTTFSEYQGNRDFSSYHRKYFGDAYDSESTEPSDSESDGEEPDDEDETMEPNP